MRTTNKVKKRSLKPFIAILAIIIIGSAGYIGWRSTHRHTTTAVVMLKKQPIDLSPATASDNAASDARKGSQNPSTTLNNGSTSTTTQTSALNAKIVSSSVNSGNLHIGTLVEGGTSGTCTLTAQQNQTTINLATSQVQQDVNNYDCGVFNIPTSRFPTNGDWKVTLGVSNGQSQGSDSTNVTITGN